MSKFKVNIETYGMEGLEKTFFNLDRLDKKRVLNNAFKKAVQPTVLMALNLVPKGRTLNLYRSIGTVSMDERIGVIVGARKTGGYKGYHGFIVEEGTVERQYITKKGNVHKTGKMNPNGRYAMFMKKAVDSTEDQVTANIEREWHDAIARQIVRTTNKDR